MNSTTATAPTWSKILPIFGFFAGFIYGKAVKKCWGCAFGFGFVSAALTAVPFAVYAVRLRGQSSNAPQTDALMNKMGELAKLNGNEANFTAKKDAINKAVGELTPAEREILQSTMQIFIDAQNEKTPAAVMVQLSAATKKLNDKYSQPTITAFNARIAALTKKYGLEQGVFGK